MRTSNSDRHYHTHWIHRLNARIKCICTSLNVYVCIILFCDSCFRQPKVDFDHSDCCSGLNHNYGSSVPDLLEKVSLFVMLASVGILSLSGIKL